MPLVASNTKGVLTGSDTVDVLYEATDPDIIDDVVSITLRNKTASPVEVSLYIDGDTEDDMFDGVVLDAKPGDSPTGGKAVLTVVLASGSDVRASTPDADAIVWFVSQGALTT